MGSDNMAEDMVEVMRTGLFAERVRRNAQMDPQPEDVLEWATIGGANILGLGQQTGSLEVGKKADLFIVDTLKPHLVPNLRIVSRLRPQRPSGRCYRFDGRDGQWVIGGTARF